MFLWYVVRFYSLITELVIKHSITNNKFSSNIVFFLNIKQTGPTRIHGQRVCKILKKDE